MTTARDDRHFVRMVVTDRTASSTLLSRRWSTATGLHLPASTVRRHLTRAGIVARLSLGRLPLLRDHQRLRLQRARERRHWRDEWRNVVFSDESRFNMSYNRGGSPIRGRWARVAHPWRYSPEEPRPTEVVADRWKYRGPCG